MINYGVVINKGEIVGYRSPLEKVHKDQEAQKEENKSNQRRLVLEGRRCLEAWQRWSLAKGGYGDH